MDPKTAMMVTKNNHNLSTADHNNVQGVLDVNDSVIGAPIIAFEDSITASTKSDVPTTAGIIAKGKIYMIIEQLFIFYQLYIGNLLQHLLYISDVLSWSVISTW